MASGTPSMLALLGLLAVAGYRNKDKISEMLTKVGNQNLEPANGDDYQRPEQAQSSSFFDEVRNFFDGNSAGATLSNGLTELVDRFKQSGFGEMADSWVGKDSNQPLAHESLAQALGEDTIAELTAKTGLNRTELLQRLATGIPDAVDDYSPEGRLPTEHEAVRYR